MNNYERFLMHRALWCWCAETGKWKNEWPGWELVKSGETSGGCFLCHVNAGDCDGGLSTLCIREARSCLGGLYLDCQSTYTLMESYDSWINRRAYQLACYRVAFVEWKERPLTSIDTYFEVRNKLITVYSGQPVSFVPPASKDYLRFVDRIKLWA